MVVTASLPYEITDHIIDHLRSYRHSLAACSLVCRAWTPRAQTLLFRSRIKMQKVLDLKYRRWSISRPEVVRYLQYIEIDMNRIPVLLESNTIHMLVSLSALRVYHAAREYFPHLSSDATPVTSLRILELHKCSFRDRQDCFELFKYFPAIEHLEVRSSSVLEQFAKIEPPELLRLRSIAVYQTDLSLVESIFSAAAYPHLRCAVFYSDRHPDQIPKLLLLLTKFREFLEDLTIDMSDFYYPSTTGSSPLPHRGSSIILGLTS